VQSLGPEGALGVVLGVGVGAGVALATATGGVPEQGG
jgi:hypothetical protein